MFTIGVDAHKRVHQAVALDERGQIMAGWRGPIHRTPGRSSGAGLALSVTRAAGGSKARTPRAMAWPSSW